MRSAEALVNYVAKGLGWEWCENGACLTVYTRGGGPIRVFVPLPNIWATFDNEFAKVGLGDAGNVGDFSVGGFFDKIHRAGSRSVGAWGTDAANSEMLAFVAAQQPTQATWPAIVAEMQRRWGIAAGNRVTPQQFGQAIARLAEKMKDSERAWLRANRNQGGLARLGKNIVKGAGAGLSLATKAVKGAVQTVKRTAQKAAHHALRFVDKHLGFVPGVRQATGLARKGLDFGQRVDRLAGKAVQNPYVQMAASAVVPGAAGAFAIYNAARALERGNLLGAASLIPGGGIVTQVARAVPVATSAFRAARRGDAAGLLRAASQYVPASAIPGVSQVSQRFANVPRMLPSSAREVFAAGQHAAQVVRNLPGNAAEERHIAAMVNAVALRDAVTRQLRQYGAMRR